MDGAERNPFFDLKLRPWDKLGKIKLVLDMENKSLSAKTKPFPLGPLRLCGEAGYSLKDRRHFISWNLSTQWSKTAILDRKETISLTKAVETNLKWSANVEFPQVRGDSRTQPRPELDIGRADIDINSVELSYDIARI